MACEDKFAKHAEYLAYIHSEPAKEAFGYLIARIGELADWRLERRPHGKITRDITCVFRDGSAPFAFTPAQNWLRFYMRDPIHTHPSLAAEQLRSKFDGVKDRRDGLYSFKIRNVEDARQAFALAFAKNELSGHAQAYPGGL